MLIWLIFALLTAACLAAVLLPLLRSAGTGAARAAFDAEIYRDQLKQLEREIEDGVIGAEEAAAARLEISRRLLASAPGGGTQPAAAADSRPPGRTFAAIAVVLCVPAIALGVYTSVGSPRLPDRPLAERQDELIDQQDLATLIPKVEDHLRANPRDGRGWKIIAPAYLQVGRYRDAANAFNRAMTFEGRDPETLTAYGEALVMAAQGLVTESAREAFLEAVKEDGSQHKAVFYLGLAEQQDGKTQSAIDLWQGLLAQGGKDAPWRSVVEAQIAAARNSLTGAPQLSKDQLADAEELNESERDEMVEGMVSRLAAKLEKNGDNLQGWLLLARSYGVLGRHDEARAALAKARTHFAGDAEALKQIDAAGGTLRLAGSDEPAGQTMDPNAPQVTEEDFNAVQEMEADDRRQMIEGMVARLAGRLEEDGSDLKGWLRLARSYTVLGKSDQAREALDKAKSHFSGNSQALAQIASARSELGLGADRTAEADSDPNAPQVTEEDMDAAQEMEADDRMQMIEGMVARLAARLEEEGGDLEGWLRLARSYTVLGKPDAAREALDKAAGNFTGDKDALARIEEAREQLGLKNG